MALELLVLCEGKAERNILEGFLRPYWSSRFIDLKIRNFEGNGDLKDKFIAVAQEHLDVDRENYVLCLVDLYEEPFQLFDHTKSHAENFEVVQQHMMQIANDKFPNHIQRFAAFPIVMELETWLLADPSIQRLLYDVMVTDDDLERYDKLDKEIKELELQRNTLSRQIR